MSLVSIRKKLLLSTKYLLVGVILAVSFSTMKASARVCPDGSVIVNDPAAVCPTPSTPSTPPPARVQNDCNGADLKPGAASGDPNHCAILDYIVLITNTLAAMVGIVVVIMIIIGGIQYSSATDNPQQLSAARDRIKNALIGLLMLIFMYAFLQWVVPGGLF